MKRLATMVCALAMTFALPNTALANHVEGQSGWFVEYNDAGQLTDNYSKNAFAEDVRQLQPGDDITLTVEMRQTNSVTSDWYLSNEVIKSLEDGDASGGAYGYTLSYEGPAGSQTLYSSKSVGGNGSEAGLADATNAMDDYFYLGTLSQGQTGKVLINVTLDGETEGNAYFDTLAQLGLKFGVEPQANAQGRTNGSSGNLTSALPIQAGNVTWRNSEHLSQTGDRTSLFPMYLAITGVGIICLSLAIRNLRNKKSIDPEGEEEHQ